MTSQIFSNIYLNELDRFVRHQVKPLAYLRYGDDFIVFCSNSRKAYIAREVISNFLKTDLKVRINPKNDVVVKSCLGLNFLGHNITEDYIVVDRHTTKHALSRLDWYNASSYKSLSLADSERIRLDWILLEKTFDIPS